MPYAEAIAKYGSDKPDLRFGLEIHDLSEVFRDSEFRVFKQIVAEGGVVRGFAVPGGNKYSRSQLDALVDQAKQLGFTGLIWVRPGEPPLSSVKALSEATLRPALDRVGAGKDDLLLMAAGPAERDVDAARPASARDCEKGKPAQSRGASSFSGSPSSRCSSGTKRTSAGIRCNHPFTAPMEEDLPLLETDPGARARPGLRRRPERLGTRRRQHPNPRHRPAASGLHKLLGIEEEDARQRFGFFLDALDLRDAAARRHRARASTG